MRTTASFRSIGAAESCARKSANVVRQMRWRWKKVSGMASVDSRRITRRSGCRRRRSFTSLLIRLPPAEINRSMLESKSKWPFRRAFMRSVPGQLLSNSGRTMMRPLFASRCTSSATFSLLCPMSKAGQRAAATSCNAASKWAGAGRKSSRTRRSSGKLSSSKRKSGGVSGMLMCAGRPPWRHVESSASFIRRLQCQASASLRNSGN